VKLRDENAYHTNVKPSHADSTGNHGPFVDAASCDTTGRCQPYCLLPHVPWCPKESCCIAGGGPDDRRGGALEARTPAANKLQVSRPFFLPSYACIRTGLILRLSTTLVQLDPTLASLPSALQRAYQQDTKTTKRAANPTWEYVPPAEENTTPPPPHVTSASAPPLPTSSQWPHNSNLSSNDRNSD